MVTTSDEQAANIAEYNDRQLALNPDFITITDQDLFDGRMAEFTANALQPLRDADVQKKEAAVAAKDPKTLETLKAATVAKKQQADAEYKTALDSALNDEAVAAVEAQGVMPSDPTFSKKVLDFLKSINPFTGV